MWGGRQGALPGLRTAVGKVVGVTEQQLLADSLNRLVDKDYDFE